MCSYVSGNFMENGGGEKSPDTLSTGGEFQPGHLYTHRPYLDLDFRKNVTWQGGTKKRNLVQAHGHSRNSGSDGAVGSPCSSGDKMSPLLRGYLPRRDLDFRQRQRCLASPRAWEADLVELETRCLQLHRIFQIDLVATNTNPISADIRNALLHFPLPTWPLETILILKNNLENPTRGNKPDKHQPDIS